MRYGAINFVLQLPPEYLPPTVEDSIAALNADFMSEIWTFFALAVPIVVFTILLKSWIRNS